MAERMAVGEFEWGGPDIGGPAAHLDELLAERRNSGGDQPRRRNLTGPEAVVRVTEFRAVYGDPEDA
jgi:hypothetical protein